MKNKPDKKILIKNKKNIKKKTNKKKKQNLKERERERGGNIVIAHRCEGKVVILQATVTPFGGQTLTGEVSVFFKTSGGFVS